MPEPDLLLLPNHALEGPRRLTLRTRPRRVCFLINPHDGSLSLAAISSACVTWGGRFHFLVPCAPGSVPEQTWDAIIEIQDPDVLVDLVGVCDQFREEHRHRGRTFVRWDDPSSSMIIAGASAWASLKVWKRHRQSGITHRALSFEPMETHEHVLPLAFRFGYLRPRTLSRALKGPLSYFSAKLEDFVDVQRVDPTYFDHETLIELLTQSPFDPTEWISVRTPGQTDHYLLPQLTSIGLPATETDDRNIFSEGVERRADDGPELGGMQPIVVVGQSDSIADLCLAWNLRAQRINPWPFPMWIQPGWLSHPKVMTNLQSALSFLRGTMGSSVGDQFQFVSASMTSEELAGLSGITVDYSLHGRDTISRFFSNQLTVGMDQDSVEHFFHGTVHINVPNYDLLGEFSRGDDIGWTLSLDSITPPRRIRALNSIGIERAGSDGFIGSLKVGRLRPGDTISLHLPPAWTLVEELLSEAGYRPEVSDKGRLVLQSRSFSGVPWAWTSLRAVESIRSFVSWPQSE